MYNSTKQVIRDSAALTDSYVAGKILVAGMNTPYQWSDGTAITGLAPTGVIHSADKNQTDLKLFYTKGSSTSLQYIIETADDLRFSLAYDGQTANFAVDEVVTGSVSGAKGTIAKDTDGGATGTLILKDTNFKKFIDNEPLIGSVAGVAVVNGTNAVTTLNWTDPASGWVLNTTTAISSGVNTISPASGTYTPAGTIDCIKIEMADFYKYMRTSFKCTGTATNSLLEAYAVVSNIS